MIGLCLERTSQDVVSREDCTGTGGSQNGVVGRDMVKSDRILTDLKGRINRVS